MTVKLGGKVIAGNVSQRKIGEIITSTIPLLDAGLHLLDGGVLVGGGSYNGFVEYIAGLTSAYPDLFCTEAQWQTSVTNYGSCDKYVYDSINNTVRLPRRTTEHGALIKSYSSETDWYRIYADGWCEQGSVVSSTAANVIYTTNFIKPLSFCHLITINGTVYQNVGQANDSIWPINGSQFNWVTGRTQAQSFYWQACGYADISDYQQSPIYEYICIATSTITQVEVDINQVEADLANKISKTDLEPCHVVIDTYINGTSWYRIYDDGWCEQGGQISGGTDEMKTITFMKKFVNDLPKIRLQRYSTTHADPGSGGLDRRFSVVTYRDSASFYVWNATWGGLAILEWQACGYLADGEY